jgi:paraquat-inducible protein B
LGSGRFFRQTKEFVLYFDSSVNGLRVAAPVKFKGVEIGSVKDIRLQLEKGMQVNKIPVIIEIDLEKLTSRGATPVVAQEAQAFHKLVVENGLRGQLLMESLVTGLLYIGLDLFPGTPINLVQKPSGDYKYTEIPTLPTTLEQAQGTATKVLAKLAEIDFKAMIDSISGAVDGINQLVNSPALKASLRNLEQTLPKIDNAVADFRRLTTNLDGSVSSLAGNLQQTSDAAREAMQQAGIALKQTDTALKEAEAAMTNIRGISDPDSRIFYELRRSLREVTAAARSLRLLSNYVERNPRALIFGRPENQEGR